MNEIKITATVMKKFRQSCPKRKLPSSGTEIAKQLGITPQMLYHYESGDRKIQFDLWWRWCEVLGVKHRTVVEKIEREIEKELKNAKDKTE